MTQTTAYRPHADWISELADEESVEWIPGFDPARHRYVRELLTTYAARRRGRPAHHSGVVGWANLRRDAPNNGLNGHFTRRVFWLAPHDPYPSRGAPCEAVDPLTVVPGTPGELPKRGMR